MIGLSYAIYYSIIIPIVYSSSSSSPPCPCPSSTRYWRQHHEDDFDISIACRPCATNYVRIMYTNDNNTSTPSSSLLAGAGAVAYQWIRNKYSI